MGITKDFILATITDTFAPTFRRPMEDLIYETLDRRQIPTRTDFKELRDLNNTLRGQVSGATKSVRNLAAQIEDVEAETETTQTDILSLQQEIQQLQKHQASLEKDIRTLQQQQEIREQQYQDQFAQLLMRIQQLETPQSS